MLFLGDGVTICRYPLLNIPVSGKTLPVEVLELVGYQGHLSGGGKMEPSYAVDFFKIW